VAAWAAEFGNLSMGFEGIVVAEVSLDKIVAGVQVASHSRGQVVIDLTLKEVNQHLPKLRVTW
jgi:hypothetical protein